MNEKTKILFIGLDAADKDLITQWANEGLLPTFKSLFGKAAWGITNNPIGLYVGAIWPSFATAVDAAKHGCYCYSQINPGTYITTNYSVFDLKGEMFWDTLSRAGRKVAIIDLPRTPPTENVNGIQVVDWLTHDPDIIDRLYTWPRSLAPEIEAKYGKDPIGYCNRLSRNVEGYQHFRDDLISRSQTKELLSRDFLNQGEWDLFLTVFSESHCVGHQCWSLHDPTHPKSDRAIADAVGDPIKDVYIALDAAVGRLLQEVGEETTVFVLASHGMGPHYDGTFMLDDILCRLENVKTPTVGIQISKVINSSWEETPILRQVLQPLRNYIWKPLRNRFWKSDKPIRIALQEPDNSNRKCFTIPNNDTYGGIRINLVDREPNGKINPGAEYEAFCQQLTEDLLAIVNVDTGKPLVSRVIRTADFYQGKYLDHLPDLMIEWNREAPITKVYSPKIGTLEKSFPGVRTGDHKAEGIVFAMGPSIEPGQVEDAISVMDFAPTIASLLGVTLPNVDGKPIASFTKKVLVNN
ncbi:alkaline phosphatase family protein [Aerosakkonemataceae cyanobacterium BLCC-F154]|uniref:Alkaline phosphatase family protein n=1 Tax=Floridaenema fluviatile BLCC-F154 TaxID=3153640 RepID=A0ABV4YAV1_9CYAN